MDNHNIFWPASRVLFFKEHMADAYVFHKITLGLRNNTLILSNDFNNMVPKHASKWYIYINSTYTQF